MSNAINCFRTITRIGIYRQVKASGVTTLVPIAIPVPPTKISLNPGDSIEEPMEVSKSGKMVPSFSYTKQSMPELEIEVPMAMSELEALIHGNVVVSGTNVNVYVQMEFKSDAVPAALSTGVIGHSVTAQDADSTAQFSYIDPVTKMAKAIEIVPVASTPTGDQMEIGAACAFEVSPELAAKAVEIVGWVPCVIASASVISATPLGLVSVFAQGVSFDNTARLLSARNCSRLAGGAIASEPTRSIKLRVLPDVADGTGLGYQMVDTALQTA